MTQAVDYVAAAIERAATNATGISSYVWPTAAISAVRKGSGLHRELGRIAPELADCDMLVGIEYYGMAGFDDDPLSYISVGRLAPKDDAVIHWIVVDAADADGIAAARRKVAI